MNHLQLELFRRYAAEMIGPADWQWIGPHMSQRMFGITRDRAEAYAVRHGGIAKPMDPPAGSCPVCDAVFGDDGQCPQGCGQ